jgi:polyhydroxyalkanoate synthesis regulator phasin
MEKLASQMLDKAKQFIENNPQIVKSTLLAGGLGAIGGAMLPTPGEDEDEPATKRMKRRLRNALLGGAVAGGAGALLSNAAYNFGTAKLQRQMTPEEKWNEIQNSTADTIKHPLTLAGGAVVGGSVGAVKDYKRHQELANNIIDDMKAQGADAIKAHNKVVDRLSGNISKMEENLSKLQTNLAGATDQADITKLQKQIADVQSSIAAKNADLATELEKIKKISVPTSGSGTGGLRRLLYRNGGDEATELLAKALGVGKTTLDESRPAVADALRALNISAVKSKVQVDGNKLTRVGRNILPRMKGNWRTLLGTAAVPLGLGITGAVMDTE